MVSELPLVSVVIICYEHGRFVEQCINSFFEQTYQNIEIYVIDNGSRDDSISNIESSAHFGRFTFIKNHRSKLTPSLNKIIPVLRGKYFVFSAADDYHKPDRVQKQVEIMQQDSLIGACSGYMVIVDNEGIPVKRQLEVLKSRTLSHADFLLRDYYFPAPAAMLRASALREMNGYDENTQLEDLYLWLKLTADNWKLFMTDEILSFYRRHNSNLSKKYDLVYNDRLYLLGKYACAQLRSRAIDKAGIDQFKVLSKLDKLVAISFLFSSGSVRWMLSKSFYNACIRLSTPFFIMDYLGVER